MSDEPVRLTVVPNSTIAEMICGELEANGIRAFTRSSSPLAGGSMTSLDPGSPAEIYVAPEDLERAQTFLPADD